MMGELADTTRDVLDDQQKGSTMAHVWSSQQDAIFNWFQKPISGSHLVVRARAGTGKTTTIIEGVNRVPAGRSILLCAFNKRIAEELSLRLTNPNAQAKTLHAIGFQAVRRFWEGVQVEKPKYGELNRAEQLSETVCGPRCPDAVKRLVSKLHTKGREINPHASKLGDLTDLAFTFECEPDEEWSISGFDVQYVETKALEAMELAASKKPAKGIDFADMIFLPVRNSWLHASFDDVIVDEAQDMTVAQLEIARGVCRDRLCVVGDDCQAIYAFRGADSGSLDRLKMELGATELGLTVTYRCGRAIVDLAAILVPDFTAGSGNCEGLVSTIAKEKLVCTANLGDFILSRLNAPLVSTAMSLLRSGKRARVSGRDVGAGLKSLIRKLSKGRAANSIPEFLTKVSVWERKEVDRKLAANRPDWVEVIRDQASMLVELADNAKSVRDLEDRIDALFTDDGLGQKGVITCSSVHRAKGLEAERVFVLADTLRDHNQEEKNIRYVAITRAQKELTWVVKG